MNQDYREATKVRFKLCSEENLRQVGAAGHVRTFYRRGPGLGSRVAAANWTTKPMRVGGYATGAHRELLLERFQQSCSTSHVVARRCSTPARLRAGHCVKISYCGKHF